MWPLRLVKAYSSDSFTSTMTATKRLLLLVAGAALVASLSRVDGFCVHSTSANFSEVKNLSAAPLRALFMECDTDDDTLSI